MTLVAGCTVHASIPATSSAAGPHHQRAYGPGRYGYGPDGWRHRADDPPACIKKC
jgi:hypothetical protein